MNWRQASVLITGGTGSFGQAFVRFMLKEIHPKKLIVFSRDELKQHEMRVSGLDHPSLRFFIGDVRDHSRLERALHGVDVAVHAAAMKQIPACEYNPIEAIQTNIIGSRNLIEAAIDQGVQKVMFISSDKAVNPINLYGATKLCGEKLFIHSNAYSGASGTRFSCVRYGNVVGSRGSVIPLFLGQRENGKISITDPRMTRFWLTLEQGVRFVVHCIERMHGGEVFVPKIPSMAIADLAKAIAPKAKMEVIGVRPGEKLHEVLISEAEAPRTRKFKEMFVIEPDHPWWASDNWKGGNRLPEGFRYSSDVNDDWLGTSQLHAMIERSVESRQEPNSHGANSRHRSQRSARK